MKTIKLNTKGIIHHLVLIIVAVVIVVAGVGVGVYEYSNHHKSHAGGWANLGGLNGNTLTWACSSYFSSIYGPAETVKVLLISGVPSKVWIAGYTSQNTQNGGDSYWTSSGWTPYYSSYLLERTLTVMPTSRVAIRVSVEGPAYNGVLPHGTINIGYNTAWPWQNLPYC